ncbi:MAG: ATP-binding cassette domain-containing protein [Puniceicoccales bacterium]|jgi:putative ABC transport system ATP-binding protein|nr:ATP-binding cassette domain-containing protein [Puniceicoccales bacterium]
MLSLKNISVSLGGQRVLDGLDLEVAKGEFVVIIGANGTGKSTLFNVISGTLPPARGRIAIGEIANNFRQVTRVFQDPRVGTVGNFTIFENMVLASNRHKKYRLIPFANRKRREFFRERLATLGMNLENRLDDLASSLSGGQRQALSLIMSVLGEYEVLLLDEITAALDPRSSEMVMALANKIVSAEGKTCLMATHNMHHALNFGGPLLVLRNGKFDKSFTGSEKQKLSPADLIETFICQ